MHADPKGAVAEGAGPAGYDKDSWEQEALIQDVVEASVLATSKQPKPVAAVDPVKSARGKPVVEHSAVLPSESRGGSISCTCRFDRLSALELEAQERLEQQLGDG
ncbi:uncharacterized protein LOC128265955 isoform X2 [Drosophila gunungcola]|uniref:uncharacterized protein LOC128265955 isoform X2 n=1 Tax=Drosophila gunungcola TaxID=103775 RepID=UPI0022E45157|nr:uncharacterized protein LOC128265955 isoform X2 [Drosophila gunungcola]